MSVTVILVVLTALISYQAAQNYTMYEKLLFRPYAMKRAGEWQRFLTHGFIHSRNGWTHLLVNMFVLYQIGEQVEGAFTDIFGGMKGKMLYLLLYLSAIVFSSVPSYLKHRDNPGYAAVGASGATSALVFAFILFAPWAWFIFPPLPGVFLAIGYLWYSNYMSKRNIDNIGHDAHMYGAIYGLLLTVTLIYYYKPQVLQAIWGNFLAGPVPPPFF